jgi:flavin reductase (DIM6/NTAB) family NADH-FMN oxidoreductase RutF
LPSERRISRRTLLESGSFAVAVLSEGGISPQALADEETKEADKIKQTDAHYQRYAKGPQRCQICLQYLAPDKCKIVQGPIIPQAPAERLSADRYLRNKVWGRRRGGRLRGGPIRGA